LNGVPPVPETAGSRALVWGALALAGILGGSAPLTPGDFGPVRLGEDCRLGIRGSGPGCSCDALDARTRLALGLPVALDRLGAEELELLDGVGPGRAAAIELERARAGAFGSTTALAQRVPGIGPAIAARVAAQLAGRPGAGCESTAAGGLR
jgi:hypothetical protein